MQNKTIIVFPEVGPLLFHLIKEESVSSPYHPTQAKFLERRPN